MITDWNCPFEEATEFIFLDYDCDVIAKRKLAVPYAAYLLLDLQNLNDNSVKLTFSDVD